MKTILFILVILLAVIILPVQESKAQALEVKPWTGTYPEMNGSYPLSFVAFKGALVPVPHEFVKLWPTHYYLQAGSKQVFDGSGYSEETEFGMGKISEKLFEKVQMIVRHAETAQMKSNAERRRDIGKIIFDAESDRLPDVYQIAAGFVQLYGSIGRLKKLNEAGDCTWLVKMYQKEADDLLLRFAGINLFLTDHGRKLDAFSELRKELSKLTGETDYTYRKVHHYQVFNSDPNLSYCFLTN